MKKRIINIFIYENRKLMLWPNAKYVTYMVYAVTLFFWLCYPIWVEKNITILKDASATSMYGARGANGVIVITTNRYTAGNLRIMYQGRVNIQIPSLGTYDNLMSASEKFELE